MAAKAFRSTPVSIENALPLPPGSRPGGRRFYFLNSGEKTA